MHVNSGRNKTKMEMDVLRAEESKKMINIIGLRVKDFKNLQ